MALTLVTPPVEEPVSVPEARRLLRFSGDAFDFQIERALLAARQEIDGPSGWLGRALLTQTWDLSLGGLPSRIILPLPPLQQVLSFSYLDDAGVSTPLDPGSYRVIGNGDDPSSVVPLYSAAWPSGRVDYGSVVLRFTCGWATPELVPELIRTYIVARAGAILEQPTAIVAGVTVQPVPYFQQSLASLRIW